jgi:hypothetical protein
MTTSDLPVFRHDPEPHTMQWEREGRIRVHDTTVSVWEEHVDEKAMIQIFQSVKSHMRARGWRVTRDPRIERHYKSLGPCRAVGARGDLRFSAGTSGRTLEVTFFQELVFENPNGAVYDHQKLSKMTQARRSLRLFGIAEMTALVRKLSGFGYRLERDVVAARLPLEILRLAEGRPHTDDPLERFNDGWNGEWEKKRGTYRFKRGEDGWPTKAELGYGWGPDRDGAELSAGQTRYAYIRGRLHRGLVYPAMNANVTFVAGGIFFLVSTHDLFSCREPDLLERRFVPGQNERLEKELAREMKAKNFGRVETLARILKARGLHPVTR